MRDFAWYVLALIVAIECCALALIYNDLSALREQISSIRPAALPCVDDITGAIGRDLK